MGSPQWFGIYLDQDHRKLLASRAALVRGAARHDDEIPFGDFKRLPRDDPWSTPFSGLDLMRSVKFSAERQRG